MRKNVCGSASTPYEVAVRAGVPPRPLRRAAPQLGADNGTVLQLFGLSPAEAADLEREGVTMTRPAADWRARQPERQPQSR